MASAPEAWEDLAKSWLIEVIDRTPLADVNGLPLSWMTREAPPLIAEILGQLSDPGNTRDVTLPPATLERAASLASQRPPAESARLLPLELAALQAQMVDALDRELPDRDRRALINAAARLAEVFGVIQSTALGSLVIDQPAEPVTDPETGFPGELQLFSRLQTLIADSNRSGAPFTIAHFEVDGLERIAKGYGEESASKMVTAVSGILRGQLAANEPAYRTGAGQFVVLAPGGPPSFEARARRIVETVGEAQGERGPRVALTVGLSGHPGSGHGPSDLMDAADEAAWAARAAGQDVALAGAAVVQDS